MAEHVTYDDFAPYYDNYMSHVDYDAWVKKVLELYPRHSKHLLHDIHELACGTANVSERLVAMGYNVSASDRSPGMIEIASHKANKPVLSVADMLDPLPESSYDLVLCMFDSINYLLTTASVEELMQNVHTGLKQDGLFIFDISTLRNSLEYFSDYVHINDTPLVTIIHEGDYQEESHLQKTRLTIFRKQNNLYEKTVEEHVQRVYSVHELVQVISNSPLTCEGIYSLSQIKNLVQQPPRKLDHQYSRLFFVLRKV